MQNFLFYHRSSVLHSLLCRCVQNRIILLPAWPSWTRGDPYGRPPVRRNCFKYAGGQQAGDCCNQNFSFETARILLETVAAVKSRLMNTYCPTCANLLTCALRPVLVADPCHGSL